MMNTLSSFSSFLFFLFFFFTFSIHAQTFTFDLSQPSTPFNHFWEECVGSGHALLGLRADWQEHLLEAHVDLGFKRVRFHGLFDDDMSALLVVNGKPTFSWFNIDTVFDFLVRIGMRPYVELSFMPEYLASGSTTIMHYKGYTSPPNNYTLWGEFISSFAQHIIDRYGWTEISQWTFEVWNEPNCGFYNGNQSSYFNFYQHTVTALKSVNPQLLVGGPATCQSGWLTDFINFCTQNKLPYDFIATHEYPTDINPTTRDTMRQVLSKARATVGNNIPLFYSEFNDGLYSNPAYHDTTKASSFLFHVLHDVQGLVDVLSWWTFTDIFEEQGQTSTPYFTDNGWGLLNIYKVPKPTYRAFEILHSLGTKEVPFVSTGPNSTAGAWAIISPDNSHLDIVIYNYDVPTAKVLNQTVTVQVSNLKTTPSYAEVFRIDDDNANAPATWLAQGSPQYPTMAQIDAQLLASQLHLTTIALQKAPNSGVEFTITVPAWGVAVVSVAIQ